ncbi:unnamed protein product, partial [Schistocephalus solidus]|uniref:Nuclear pore complex protein Nup85 n=1 Tax=Schistocephalus solidus TaxID=70667 RepID=A0A183S8C4_SCHSO
YSLVSWHFVQSQDAANIARNILATCGRTRETYSFFADTGDELFTRFWPTVLTLVLQARTIEAAALLAAHPSANSTAFRSIRQLLNNMPFSESGSSVSAAETMEDATTRRGAWEFWQRTCFQRLSEGDFGQGSGDSSSEMSYLHLIASILAGRQAIWDDVRIVEACGQPNNWYFRLTAWIFYTARFVGPDLLLPLVEQWRQTYPPQTKSPNSPLDEVIDKLVISIFSADIISLLNTAGEKFSNWWLVAHMSNFLKRLCPKIFESEVSQGNVNPIKESVHVKLEDISTDDIDGARVYSLLSDFFLFGYAESLASEPGLLSVALGYLDYCSSAAAARGAQASLIAQLIQEARRRGLHNTADEIARVKVASLRPLMNLFDAASGSQQPVVSVSRTDNAGTVSPVCSALGWAILAQNRDLVTQLVTRLLWAGMPRLGSLVSFQLSWKRSRCVREVATIVSCLFGGGCHQIWLALSPEIAFLVRYAELQQILVDKKIQAAVNTVLDLLTANSVSDGSVFEKPNKSKELDSTACQRKWSPHLPVHFQLHLLMLIKPHLTDVSCLRRDQIELLTVMVTDLRASIGLMLLDRSLDPNVAALNDWFFGLHDLLARARAVVNDDGDGADDGDDTYINNDDEYDVEVKDDDDNDADNYDDDDDGDDDNNKNDEDDDGDYDGFDDEDDKDDDTAADEDDGDYNDDVVDVDDNN